MEKKEAGWLTGNSVMSVAQWLTERVAGASQHEGSGDTITGEGAVKVGGNAGNISTNSAVPYLDQGSAQPTQSETKRDSLDKQSASSKTEKFTGDKITGKGAVKVGGNAGNIFTNSTVPLDVSSTRSTDYDVAKILEGEDEETIRDVRDKLHKLGVNNLKGFEDLTEKDLMDGGIKKVQARKLLRYYANHQPQQSASDEIQVPMMPIKTEEDAGRKRTRTTRQKVPSKRSK